MGKALIGAMLAVSLFPLAALAQQQPFRWPEPPPPPQTSQPAEPAPPPAAPAPTAAVPAAPLPRVESAAPTPRAKPTEQSRGKPAGPPARVIACSGAFAKTASQDDLVKAFGQKNVVFTKVDGLAGSKLDATVVFPRDARQRIEVLWHEEPARRRPRAIVITGRSTWSAPKGARLGLTLATLERLNGKPFKISGFDQRNAASVLDWQGGTLADLPGGCLVGMQLRLDVRAPPKARSEVTGGREFQSSDREIRAVRPRVNEIVLGYSG
jgi:hypothetical protein